MEKELTNIRGNSQKDFKIQPNEFRDIEEEERVERELKKLGYI
jgi:hypothetical protein